MKIIPAIDLIGGKTVRLEQGEYERRLSYDVDPVDAARRWQDMGAELIHVIDLDGAKEGKPCNLSTTEKIVQAVDVPIETGGGFRTETDIEAAIKKGVSRVVVGSRAFEDMGFAKTCTESFGIHVIFSLDVRNNRLGIHGWEDTIDLNIPDVLNELISFGTKEIIYTDITRDGTLSGPNTVEIKRLLDAVDIQIISAGGVKTVDHIQQLKALEEMGLSGVIIGRALYEGTIDLKEAIDAGKADNTVS